MSASTYSDIMVQTNCWNTYAFVHCPELISQLVLFKKSVELQVEVNSKAKYHESQSVVKKTTTKWIDIFSNGFYLSNVFKGICFTLLNSKRKTSVDHTFLNPIPQIILKGRITLYGDMVLDLDSFRISKNTVYRTVLPCKLQTSVSIYDKTKNIHSIMNTLHR